MTFSDSHPADADRVWTSPKSIQIPPTGILEYALGNLDQYDKDRRIFIDANNPSSSISAQEAARTILQLSRGLKARGLKDGDCVCVHSFNNIWYPLLWLAIVGCGGRVVGSNPKYTKSELVHLLDLTKPVYIISQASCLEPMAEAAAVVRTKIEASNIFIIDPITEPANKGAIDNTSQCAPAKFEPFDAGATSRPRRRGQNGFSPDRLKTDEPLAVTPSMAADDPLSVRRHPSWRTLLLDGATDWPESAKDGKFDQERIAVYGMTSGTTGAPKAALISHRALVAQAASLEEVFRAKPYKASQLISLPVFHAFAAPLALLLPLRLGVPTFFLPKWSLSECLRAIETQQITDIPVCPPIVSALAEIQVSEHVRLRSLRCVISAGAALPATVQNKFQDILTAGAVVTQVWGTTEAGWHTLGDLVVRDLSGTVGRLLPNAELKLVCEDGSFIDQDGQQGEALIKTSTLFSGYLGNLKAGEQAFDSMGFYRTGDQVFVQDGKLYYTDRIKETMKVKGWQVSPTELESVLLQHAQIADAAVVGVTLYNEVGLPETFPTAYVVRCGDDDAATLSGEEVKGFIAARVISYKRITGEVFFVKQIPRSPSGKILRRNLPQAERDLGEVVTTATAQERRLATENEREDCGVAV